MINLIKPKKINLRKNEAILTVAHEQIASGTRATAQKIAKFARRPLYWGNELIGAEWVTAEI